MHIETICRVDVQLDAKMCRRVSTEKKKQIRVIQISRYKYNNNNNNNKATWNRNEFIARAIDEGLTLET